MYMVSGSCFFAFSEYKREMVRNVLSEDLYCVYSPEVFINVKLFAAVI